MGAPVMVDDGGSIRIKLALLDPDSAGVMDSLFDVSGCESAHERNSTDPYTKALVFYLDEDGNLNPGPPVASLFKKVLIYGDVNINVEVERKAGGKKLKIRVFGNGVDPQIESRQHNNKRSYSVANAGRIIQVDIEDDNGVTNSINIPPTGIYTSVVIT